MNKAQAVNAFWNSFGLKAYDENTVPDDAHLPYITYDMSEDDFGNEVAQSVSLWYKTTTWAEITLKAMEIEDRITKGGIIVHYDEPQKAALWIKKANPWAQRMSDDSDETIRRMLLNVSTEYLY